jgi:signal transduction histidine kinase
MSPKSEQIERELLTLGFRTYPRGLANGFVFASMTAALMWLRLPHAFLVGWLAVVVAIQFARLAMARAFLHRDAPPSTFARWTRLAAIGYGATGLAWGVLGAAAIHFAFDEKLYILWVGFLIVLFAVLQSQTTGAKPLVLRSFVACAAVPIIAISLAESSPNYALRLVAEILVFGIALLAGSAGNRNAAASVAMRFENVELLQELRRQKDEVDRANIAKTRFLAAASHDLRQPLQAIVLLAESLHERVRDPSERLIAESIRSAARSMSSLLNEILDLSRFEAGTVKPQVSSFAVLDVLERLRGAFTETAANKGVVLRVRKSGAVVQTDPILLYRILLNLVDNALRYTQRGGVLVGCRRRGRQLSIEVWDTGVGIPADQLRNVFQEFYQVENHERDSSHGLGLGLAIVERTAGVLGHSIAVRSRAGRGSVFSVAVPFGDPALARIRERVAPEPLAGTRVLVVEDSADIRAAMTLLLEGWGCRVSTASSAAQADEVTAHEPAPDVVLADYGLPGAENGLEYLRRARLAFPGVAAILISGNIDPAVLREAENAGLPLLHKPLRPARLRALVGSLLRNRTEAAIA